MAKKKEQQLQAAIDRGDYGRPMKYDETFMGPKSKRSCTDIICLLLFFCFVVAWIIVGAIAFNQGNPSKIIAPVDSDGKRCGFDDEVIDKKYLFYFDITQCKKRSCDTPQVCVEKCPVKSFWVAPGNYFNASFEDAICRGKQPENEEEFQDALRNNRCASWYLPFKSVGRRCIYMKTSDLDYYFEKLQGVPDTGIENLDQLKSEIIGALDIISQTKKIGETIVSELKKNWPLLLAGFAIAMVLCMIYIVIMRWFAWIIVWVTLFGLIALLVFCCYGSWVKYEDAKGVNENYSSNQSTVSLKITWLILFIASCIVLVVVLIIVIFLRNRIRIATALISEGSKAIGSITTTLFFPLAPWLLQMGVLAWAVFVWMYLASSGLPVYRVKGLGTCVLEGCEYKDGDPCDPKIFNENCSSTIGDCSLASCAFKEYESRSYTDYFHAVNIVGIFWVLCFISALTDMVLAGTFASWYWRKSDVPFFAVTYSLGRTIRYHLGTLAFGSLILAICRLIRVTLEFINSKLRKYDNGLAKALMCFCQCFFWCLEKFIKFINRNAYIMCAIHGKNFCRSARKAFNLLMRNIVRVFVLDKVTDFLLLLGKLLITGGMMALAYYVFSRNVKDGEDEEVPDFTYYLLPVILVGIGTYFITCIFFAVYAMAVDTLFLCVLEDMERNDGSPERPYRMSKKLMKILGKKNKKYKERLE